MSEVVSIHIVAQRGDEPQAVERVEAVTGTGLRGDHHFEPGSDPARQLTLIESEEIERLAAEHAITLAPGQSRRQLTTRGVRLNPLVGKRFRVGEVECRGIELCEPCTQLQRWTEPAILRAMVHRAGLNAEIITGGEIAVGDSVVLLDA